MNAFFRGLGGGVGRTIGRIVGLLIVGVLGYLIITGLDIDIKNILPKMLYMDVSAKQQTSTSFNIYTNYDSACGSGGTGYCAVTTNNTPYLRTKGNTYNGVLQGIDFYISYVLNPSYQYSINIYAMSTDFRNNDLNVYVYGFNNNNPSGMVPLNYTYSFVSKSQITINLGGYYNYQNVAIYMTGNPLTGISTYGIKKIELVYDDGSTDMSGVIDNQNQNTSDIINNNNNNTQDVINSINDFITNVTCPTGPLSINFSDWGVGGNGYLNSDGSINSSGNGRISPYFSIKPSGDIKYTITANNSISGAYACLYTSAKSLITCYQMNTTNLVINGSTRASFLRFSINRNTSYTLTGPVCNDWQKEATDLLNNTNKETNDLIKDDNVDSGVGSDFFNDFQDNAHGLSGIITLPLATIQSLTTQTCSPLHLPLPFVNKFIDLPCLTEIYQQKVPGLLTLIRTLWYGILSYYVLTDIFFMVKGFKDPDSDKIEVLDL